MTGGVQCSRVQVSMHSEWRSCGQRGDEDDAPGEPTLDDGDEYDSDEETGGTVDGKKHDTLPVFAASDLVSSWASDPVLGKVVKYLTSKSQVVLHMALT